jgi:hypothetical protein
MQMRMRMQLRRNLKRNPKRRLSAEEKWENTLDLLMEQLELMDLKDAEAKAERVKELVEETLNIMREVIRVPAKIDDDSQMSPGDRMR